MITIDARWYRSSGIGTYVKNIVPHLIERLPGRFSLIGSPADLISLASERVTIIPAPTKMYSMRRIPVPSETKLFFAPHYPIPLSYRGPLLTTIHDVCHLAMPELFPGLAKHMYALAMLYAVRVKSSRIICVSQFSADELKRHVGADSTVIYNGVSADWFDVRAVRPHHAPYLVYVGNVKPHKNVGGLVAAYQSIRGRIPHDLVIIGQREGFITGDDIADAPGIHFTGRLSDDELRGWVKHADALVFPSFYEGFGLPPLEAMACGCPVVVSNCSSMPEICRDAAIYCDPGNPEDIAARIMEAIGRSDLKEKGRARAQQFSWKTCADKTTEVVNEILHLNRR